MAVGYATLYGDMAGGFAVLKDIAKTLVYRLCALPQQRSAAVIPERIITRAPSAELRADQTDQDILPPYDVLDAHPRGLRRARPESRRDRGARVTRRDDVRKVVRLIKISEYKRRQAAGRHPHHAARVRQGLALSDHLGVATGMELRRPQRPASSCQVLRVS